MIRAFILGFREARLIVTWADPDRTSENPYTRRDRAYDRGRTLADRLSGRTLAYNKAKTADKENS